MKKQQGFIVPLLVFIIVALVVGGGVYINSQKKNADVTVNSNTNATDSSPKSGRSTHTDSKYGFKLDYPSTWVVQKDNTNPELTILYPKDKESQIFNKTISTADEVMVGVMDEDRVKVLLISAYTKNIDINGQTWSFTKTSQSFDGETEEHASLQYFRKISSKKYVVVSSGIKNKSIIESIAASLSI